MRNLVLACLLILANVVAAAAQTPELTTPRLGLPIDHPAGPATTRDASTGPGTGDLQRSVSGVVDRSHPLRPAEIVLRCAPAVVAVRAVRASQPPSEGSGFFVSASGLLVTCNHVVSGATSVDVTTRQGRTFHATVIATQPETDLALLRVDAAAPFLPLADSSAVGVGEHVLALGHPLGLQYTLSDGLVSALRDSTAKGVDFIQFSAPVSTGCSGGPLLDGSGRVVGVISLSHGGGQNLNFAVPVNYVRQMVARTGDGTAIHPGSQGSANRPSAHDAAPGPNSEQALPSTVGLVPALSNDVASASGPRTFMSGGHGFTVACPALWQLTSDAVDRGLVVRMDSPDGRLQMDFATVSAGGLDLEAFTQLVSRALESSLVSSDLGNGVVPFLGVAEGPRLLRSTDVAHAGFNWRVLVHLHRAPDGAQRYVVTMLTLKNGQAYLVRYSAAVDEWEKTKSVVQRLVDQVKVF